MMAAGSKENPCKGKESNWCCKSVFKTVQLKFSDHVFADQKLALFLTGFS